MVHQYATLYSVVPTDSTTGTEATYTGYARVAIARTTGGFTVSGTDPTRVINAADITFPSSTSTETILGFGLAFTIAGDAQYFGTFSTSLSVISGVQPKIIAGQLKINED